MESYSFDHIQPNPSVAHIVLVKGVKNSLEILEDVKKGAKKFDQMPMTLIDSKMICSKSQLMVSIHQSILRNCRNEKGLKTKTIHSEILWNLSLTNNIAETFKIFGLSESTSDLLIVHIAQPPEKGGPDSKQILEKIESIIEGEIAVDGLASLDSWKMGESQRHIDWQAICKAYKLGDLGANVVDEEIPSDERNQELIRQERIDSIVTSMVAMKFVSS